MKGKWLSYILGIYNGGGYSGAEKNKNKVFATRISTRPLANILPQLQLSAYYNIGKGNIEESPDFDQILGFLAFTGRNITTTIQAHKGKGDFRAKYIHENDRSKSKNNYGHSVFCEYRIPHSSFAIWGRYDSFTVENHLKNDVTLRRIAGITYRINKNLRLVLNTEYNELNEESNEIYELNMEVSF